MYIGRYQPNVQNQDIKNIRFYSFFVCLTSILFAFFVLLKQALIQNLFIKCSHTCKHKGDHNVNNDSSKTIDNNETDRATVSQIVEIDTIN